MLHTPNAVRFAPLGITAFAIRCFSGSAAVFARAARAKKIVPEGTKLRRQVKILPKPVNKRAPSALNFYVKENYKKVAGEKSTATLANLAKSWSSLPEQEKQKYEKLAAAAKAAVVKKLENLTPAEVIQANASLRLRKKLGIKKPGTFVSDPSAPKRPLTSYMLFSRDIRAASADAQKKVLGGAISSFAPKDAVSAIATAWKALPAERKQLYENQSKSDFAEYSAVSKAYAARNKVSELRKSLKSDLTKAARGRVVKKVAKKKVKKVLKKKQLKKKKLVSKAKKSTKKAVKKVKKSPKKAVKKPTKKPVKKTTKKTKTKTLKR